MHSFKDLTSWSRSMDVVKACYELTADFPKQEAFGLTSQIRRSAVSIPSNIAEGAGRRTGPDFNRFLRIAYGSACELETQLLVAVELRFVADNSVQPIVNELDRIRRMLYGLSKSLATDSAA